MPRFMKSSLALAGMACLGLACVGSVSQDGSGGKAPGSSGSGRGNGSSGNGSGGSGSGTVNPPPPPLAPEASPGEAVFRRLTRTEYNNTIRDLLGDSSNPADSFPGDTESAHSGFARGGPVSTVDATRIFDATEKLTREALASRAADFLPCGASPAEGEQEGCTKTFITKFGLRAYRRPLIPAEENTLFELYKAQRDAGSAFTDAVRVVMSAMLLSPNFLYRWETVPEKALRDGEFLRYNGYEMASRLSYLFWSSMPDEELFAAAGADQLASSEQIDKAARRLLKDEKAKGGFRDFAMQWLEVSELPDQRKDPAYTKYTPEVAAAMLDEVGTFLAELMMNGDGKLASLLTAPHGFPNAGLAAIYGKTGVTGDTLTKTTLDETQRAGIFTLGAFPATHAKAEETNPITRGVTVMHRLLCTELPVPPDDIPLPKPPAEGVTTRERFADHGTNPCATACHSIIDPLGFAFENYDAVGAWRTMDYGKPVDAAASLELDGQKVDFNNAVDLMGHLAKSKQVSECVSRQWLRYALRHKETSGDAASIAAAQEAFASSDHDLRELMVALTKTKTFTHRAASKGEVLP